MHCLEFSKGFHDFFIAGKFTFHSIVHQIVEVILEWFLEILEICKNFWLYFSREVCFSSFVCFSFASNNINISATDKIYKKIVHSTSTGSKVANHGSKRGPVVQLNNVSKPSLRYDGGWTRCQQRRQKASSTETIAWSYYRTNNARKKIYQDLWKRSA